MKFLLGLLTAAFILSTTVNAADTEAKVESTTDSSTNPLTGTKTTTKKYKKKHKNGAGKAEDTVTEKTKEYKDGGAETTTETKSATDPK